MLHRLKPKFPCTEWKWEQKSHQPLPKTKGERVVCRPAVPSRERTLSQEMAVREGLS